MLPELHTARLILREVQLEDGPALQAFQNHPDQWRHQAIEPEEFADGVLRIRRYQEHRGPDSQRRLYVYVAQEKRGGALIGQAGLSRFFHPGLASLSFGVARDQGGQGYATEMAARLLAFGFDEIGLHRISADIAIENAPSTRVAEKIGMSREGITRDCIWAQGRWWTEAKYAILADDFRRGM